MSPAPQVESRAEGEPQPPLDATEAPPEVRTLLHDLYAFQREEMQALQAYLALLLQRASREELLVAFDLHTAARARTKQCLLRMHEWHLKTLPP